MEDDNLKTAINEYWQLLIYCDAALLILESMNVNEKWEILYGFSPTYFKYVSRAFTDSIVVSINKLFEGKGKQGNNIFKFIEEIKQSIHYSELKSIITKFEAILNSEIIGNIKVWRDKYIAHYDNEYFYKRKNLAEFPLEFNKLKELITYSLDYLSKISYVLDNKTHLYNIHPFRNDFENLFDIENYFKRKIELEKFKTML